MGHIVYVPLFLCPQNVLVYTDHQNVRSVTLFARAAVLMQPVTYCLAIFSTLSGQVPPLIWVQLLYRMPYSPLVCFALRCCNSIQYSVLFGYITCHCICFFRIVFCRSGIYCLIFTLYSTMPSVLRILC